METKCKNQYQNVIFIDQENAILSKMQCFVRVFVSLCQHPTLLFRIFAQRQKQPFTIQNRCFLYDFVNILHSRLGRRKALPCHLRTVTRPFTMQKQATFDEKVDRFPPESRQVLKTTGFQRIAKCPSWPHGIVLTEAQSVAFFQQAQTAAATHAYNILNACARVFTNSPARFCPNLAFLP